MTQTKLLIGAGVGCFILFMLTLVPARVMSALIPAEVATMADTSGTLWNGRARSVDIGIIQLRDVDWDLHALSLLIGRLSLTLDAKWGNGYLRGDFAAGLTGSLKLRDVQALGPLTPVLKELNLSGNGGELSVDIAKLDFVDQWPTQIIGSVRIGRLPLSMLGISGGSTGSYALEFNVEEVVDEGAIPGVLSDGGGPLEVLGELRLMPPRDYTIEARVKARPEAPSDLVRGLVLVGPQLPDGSHEFQMTGSL